MANLQGKLGQVPGGTAVINTEAYAYFVQMQAALKRDKAVDLVAQQGYLSKFEVTDELRKLVKNKQGDGTPLIASMLDPKAKIEDILGVKPASSTPSGSTNPTGSTPPPPPTGSTFPADSYPKLETYIKSLKPSDFTTPLYTAFKSPEEDFDVLPFPNYPGLDPRQTGNLVVVGPKENIKPDILTWIYNNSILYGFIPYGNPQTQALYYVGVQQLKNKVKKEESVAKVVSIFLQKELLPDQVTITVDKVITHSLTGGTEFTNPGNFDYIVGTVPNNAKVPIQLVNLPHQGTKLLKEDVATAFEAMYQACKKEIGAELKIGSDFRPPFKIEGGLKTKSGKTINPYTQYGCRKNNAVPKGNTNEDYLLNAKATAFSPQTAPPGSSNHGNGIAMDISAKPATYLWMAKNAHTYGFLRAVSSEDWHWEYYPPNKPKKNKNGTTQSCVTGPYTLVPKSHATWHSGTNAVDWQSAGPFKGNASTT
jgi:hypothetical protein